MNKFRDWIEQIPIESVSHQIVAINFNLYETDDEECFHAQLIACDSYDANNDDWACKPIFSSEENIYEFEAEDWEDALDKFKNLVSTYLKENVESQINKIAIITAGFVDGDLITIKPTDD